MAFEPFLIHLSQKAERLLEKGLNDGLPEEWPASGDPS